MKEPEKELLTSFLTSLSAPALRRRFTIAVWPWDAAVMSEVSPSCHKEVENKTESRNSEVYAQDKGKSTRTSSP